MSMNDEPCDRLVHHLRWMVAGSTLRSLPDKDLLRRFVVHHDENAFAALLRRHAGMVWGICRRFLSVQDAEDAFQVSFLILARKARSIRRGELLANWLFGVARRVASSTRRRRARQSKREALCQDFSALRAPARSPDDTACVLNDELARLPDKYRIAVLLCGVQGMTHEDAGRNLGWPTGTVASRLWRGREILRRRLFRRGIAVSTVTLTTLLGQQASAAVPLLLITAVMRNASLALSLGFSAALSGSVVPAGLLQATLRNMALSKLVAATCLATFTLVLGCAGFLWLRALPEANVHRVRVASLTMPSNRAPRVGPSRILLPADGEAVVLQLERSLDDGQSPRVRARIHADGRIIAELPSGVNSLAPGKLAAHRDQVRANRCDSECAGETRIVEGKLSPQELQELLRFIVLEQDFFQFDPEEVRTALARAEPSQSRLRRFDHSDVTTTTIRVQTANLQHEVQWPRLYDASWKHPTMKPISQLYAVDMRLRQEVNIVLAGGLDFVEEIVGRVNAQTRQFFSNAPQFTARDLHGVVLPTSGGAMSLTFYRPNPRADYPDFVAQVEWRADAEPIIRFSHPLDSPIQHKPTEPVDPSVERGAASFLATGS
jgi:RNA polymerase sigma factor (sigma-70 family)